MKLHLGCGRNAMPGWLNVDSVALPGVDRVADLDDLAAVPLPLEDDSVDEFLAAHLIEHLRNPLPFMQELWRVAKPGAMLQLRVPYGSSDDTWEDPTHIRPYFLNSFTYFQQPAYCRADYGYRGDWQCDLIRLFVSGDRYRHRSRADVLLEVHGLRNVVMEMHAFCYAVKPGREPVAGQFVEPRIEIIATSPGTPDTILA